MRLIRTPAAALSLILLSACVTMGQLEPLPLPPMAGESQRVPLTVVDVLVISQPGFEVKKGFGLIPPPAAHTARTGMLADSVAQMMRDLTSDLKFKLGEAGISGAVRFEQEGYRPSEQRTHLLTVVPLEATQTTTMTTTTVQVSVYQIEGQRLIWRGKSVLAYGKSLNQLSGNVLATLQSLGVKAVPTPPARPIITAIPVQLGDSVAAVQAALGTTASPQRSESATRDTSTSLRLPERGLMVFFGADNVVQTLRFDAPYAGEVRGIKLGSTRQTVLESLGEPTRIFETLPMRPSLLYRSSAGTVRYDLDLHGKVQTIFVFKPSGT